MRNTFITLFFFLFTFSITEVQAQYYPNIVSHHFNNTPTNGVKIKTNIPFQNSAGMPLIKIQGYNYGEQAVLDLSIVWYIYGNVFVNHSVASAGNSTPEVRISNESGKVTIHLNQNVYFQRFFVSAFAQGMLEQASHYTGWTVLNEAFGGTASVLVPYKNAFTGDVKFNQGIWNTNGNVGIGTTTPTNKLEVNGTIKTKEVNVTTAGWPDYVFAPDYNLIPLDSLKEFILANRHLPDVPSEKSVLENGVNLGEMDKILLQKVEELTLYLIDQKKETEELRKEIKQLKAAMYPTNDQKN
jgi:hypothetical protein